MVYFFINLIIHIAVSVFLLGGMLRFIRMNRTRKNRKGLTFFMPVVCVAIFSFHAFTNTLPKMADIPAMVQSTYQPMKSGIVESVGWFNNTVVIDGVKYYFNPFAYKPVVGDHLNISATEYAKYIAHFSIVELKE